MATTSTAAAPAAPLSLDEIEAAAARLSTEEREELVERLTEIDHPTDPEVKAAWNEEIARRLEEVRSGKVECIPFNDVMAEMQARFCR